MINSEIIGLCLILCLYILIGAIAYANIKKSLEYGDGALHVFDGSKIVSQQNVEYLKTNANGIAILAGFLWIFFAAFSTWYDIGGMIYDNVIIGKDEKSRIASWFV